MTPPKRKAVMDWSDVAPSDVVMRQRAWDRRQLVLRMIDLGGPVAAEPKMQFGRAIKLT